MVPLAVMDRKGQTWQYKSTVLAILSSAGPEPGSQYWRHDVVYLTHPNEVYVGVKLKLEEAIGGAFESETELQRLT